MAFLVGMEKQITAIEAQKRNRNRVNISLDGEFAFSLDRLTAVWLKPGRKLSESDIEQLLAQDELENAFARALHFLGYRARSTWELQDFLEGKGVSVTVIISVMDRLKQEGYLDDTRFSQDWVENRSTFRPRSQSLLKTELRHKGIAEPTIQTALDKANLDDIDLAFLAGRKIAGRYTNLTWEEFRTKLRNHLLRRGFTYQVVNQVTRQVWSELQNSGHMDATL